MSITIKFTSHSIVLVNIRSRLIIVSLVHVQLSLKRRFIILQIPYVPLKNSKQLAHKLNIAVGQRTEIAINKGTDDDLTNGASNVIKHTH